MMLLLRDGQELSDEAARQRVVAGLVCEPVALKELESDDWSSITEQFLSITPLASDEEKWVTTSVGPLKIKDRAAAAVKAAGFSLASNTRHGKTWEKHDGGNLHRVTVQPNGNWLHQSLSDESLSNGFAEGRNLARGGDHATLARHMEMMKAYQFGE